MPDRYRLKPASNIDKKNFRCIALAEVFREQIEQGTLKSGDRLPFAQHSIIHFGV